MKKIKFVIPILYVLLPVIGMVWVFYPSHSSSVIQEINLAEQQPLEKEYYMIYSYHDDPITDDFIKDIETLAPEYQINKIYKQTLNLDHQRTTLFYMKDNESVRRVRSDQSLEELKAFFEDRPFTPTGTGYELIDTDNYVFKIKNIIMSHLLTNREDIENIDEDNYVVTIQYYIYNKTDENQEIDMKLLTDTLKKHIVIKDNQNDQINQPYVHTSINTSTMNKGDRAKGTISFPVEKLEGVELEINQHSIPLETLELRRTVNDEKFDF